MRTPGNSTIADLVKHSRLPVIKCKEILQTLMRLQLIDRKREKAVSLSLVRMGYLALDSSSWYLPGVHLHVWLLRWPSRLSDSFHMLVIQCSDSNDDHPVSLCTAPASQ